MATKKRKVPIKLTISFDDAYQAYQKGKNTAQEPALLKKLYAAKRAVKRAEEGPYDHKKVRPSTSGRRREAGRLFGRQEETVEHEGRLQRIPGSVVGPNERHKRVTQKEKQRAADLTGLGLEIASYAIGAGQMIGLITGAAKLLTPAAAKLFAKGGEKALSQAAIKRANTAARKAAKDKAEKAASEKAARAKKVAGDKAAAKRAAEQTRQQNEGAARAAAAKKAAAKKAAKKADPKTSAKPKIVKTGGFGPKKPVSPEGRILDDQARRAARASQQKAVAAKKAPKKAAAAKTAADKKAAAAAKSATGSKVAAGSTVAALTAGLVAAELNANKEDAPTTNKQGPRRTHGGRGRPIPEAKQPTIGEPVVRQGAAKKKVGEPVEGQGAGPSVPPTLPVPRAKPKRDKDAALKRDKDKATKLRSALDKMSAAERKSLGPVTNFMEKFLGLNRDKATIERDMAADKKIEEELKDEMLEFYGKKRGGKVTAKRPTAKKYAMNRGGMASLRKPTRA